MNAPPEAGPGTQARRASSSRRLGVTRAAARPKGRPPGSSGATRERILEAARQAFAEHGFEGATLRDVAARAGVDPALVHHYFGPKHRLFVAATLIPVDFETAVPQLLDGPPDELGERFVRFMLELWDRPRIRPLMLGLVRSATTDPIARSMLRRLIETGPLLALANALDRPDAPLRATLVGSQFVGLIMARFVVGIEPLASADREAVVRAMGPTIQRYLAGDLGSPTASAGTIAAHPAVQR